jgi:hypothetical protein
MKGNGSHKKQGRVSVGFILFMHTSCNVFLSLPVWLANCTNTPKQSVSSAEFTLGGGGGIVEFIIRV